MEQTQTTKVIWISGEICVFTGAYFADTCGHTIRKDYRKNDVFMRCPTCHQAVRWMRLNLQRPVYHNSASPETNGEKAA